MIRLVGFDLDGTVLTPDKKITQHTRRVMETCARMHTVLVPVTGRPFWGIPDQIRSMDFIHCAITSNGSVTSRVPGGETIRNFLMDDRTVKLVLESAAAAATGKYFISEVFTGGIGYHNQKTDIFLQERYHDKPALLDYFKASRKIVPDLYAFLPGRYFENISLMFESAQQCRTAQISIEKISGIRVIVSAPTDLEIVNERADKGRALTLLAADLGVGPDEILAAGDGSNDRELLACAHISVAMGNAKEDLRQMADYVTQDNRHEGFSRALERFVLGKR